MGSRAIARVALLAAAAALCTRCSNDTTTSSTSAYIPLYYDWTIGYDPFYAASLDPFYYADPYWALALSAAASPASTEPPAQFNDLGTVSDVLVKLNQALAPAFGSLKQLAAGRGTDMGGGIQHFGPADLPSGSPFATFRLQARSLSATRVGWKLEAKPLGAGDEAYSAVTAGTLGDLVEDHRGSGTLVVSFSRLHQVNPAKFAATGVAIVAAAQAKDQVKAVVTRLREFSADGVLPARSGVLAGDRTSDGVSHVRVVTDADVVTGPATERIADRIAWKPKSGGRGYAIVSGGDVDAGKYLLGRSCWASKDQLVFRDWHACDASRVPSDCLADASAVVRVDTGTDPSVCAGPEPQLPRSAGAVDGPTESAPVSPPALPDDLPLDLPQ
jgi:hypothetical protein